MTIEYRFGPEDVLRLQRIVWSRQRLRRWLILWFLYGMFGCLIVGGLLIVMSGPPWGCVPMFFGMLLGIAVVGGHFGARPTLAKVRAQREKEPWLDATYRVTLDDAGMTWAHPGVEAHLRWDGVAEVVERGGFFCVFERPSAAQMIFALPHSAFVGEAALAEARELFRRHVRATRLR